MLGFAWFYSSESGLFKGLRRNPNKKFYSALLFFGGRLPRTVLFGPSDIGSTDSDFWKGFVGFSCFGRRPPQGATPHPALRATFSRKGKKGSKLPRLIVARRLGVVGRKGRGFQFLPHRVGNRKTRPIDGLLDAFGPGHAADRHRDPRGAPGKLPRRGAGGHAVKPTDRLDAADRIEHRVGRLLVDIAGIGARSLGQDGRQGVRAVASERQKGLPNAPKPLVCRPSRRKDRRE